MKVSQLIKKLEKQLKDHGDVDVEADCDLSYGIWPVTGIRYSASDGPQGDTVILEVN